MDRIALLDHGIQGVVFDKDGTLIDFTASWAPALIASAEHLAAQLGRPQAARDWLVATGQCPDTGRILPGTTLASGTTRELVAEWRNLATGLPAADVLVPWLDAFWHARVMETLAPIGPVDALMTALRGAGVVLAVVTNDSEAAAHETIDRLGLAGHFAFVAGYDSGHGSKPDPGVIRAAQDHFGLERDRTAMVRDSPADLIAGRQAGCGLVVGVLSGTGDRETLEPLADVVVADVHALSPVPGCASTP
jgi:phosphoglycolate phosphatase